MEHTEFNIQIGFYQDHVLVKNNLGNQDIQIKIDSNGHIKVIEGNDVTTKPIKTVYGQSLLGIIRLNTGFHLLLINEYEKVGLIQGKAILKVSNTSVLKIGSALITDSNEKKLEKKYVNYLKSALSVKSYYFSYEYDVTSSLQRQSLADENRRLWEKANPDFFYNYHLSEPLIEAARADPRVGSIITPIISGFIEIRLVWLKNQGFSIGIITRRSRHKQGTRYFSRGVDDNGNVSNSAETEQIIQISQDGDPAFADIHGLTMSFLQIRGSVPVRWAQVITGQYKPRMEINLKDSEEGFKKHMEMLSKNYGSFIMVNLADKVKYEKPVSDSFSAMTEKHADKETMEYVHFDFHKECSKMRFDKVSILIDQIQGKLDSFGSFAIIPGKSEKPIKTQAGVIRTNCMDCLDRTNVVQSVLATSWLVGEFRKMKLLGENETFDGYKQITATLRTIWTDNADHVSLAYSGTGALKTEYTRTGKYTKVGLLNDGYNSVERYIRNNFLDGKRQDTYDLFLGYHKISEDGEAPTAHTMTMDGKILLGTVLSSVFMVLLTLFFLPFKNLFSFKVLVSLILWPLAVYYGTELLLKKHAFEVLSWPSLVAYPHRPLAITTNTKVQIPFVSNLLDSNIGKLAKRRHIKTD